VKRFLAVLFVASLFSLANASPVNATHDSTCNSGDFCLWGEDNYLGCAWTRPNSTVALSAYTWFNCSPATASPDNGANSFQNRGSICTIAMFDWPYYSGGYRWASRIGLGGWWADSNLANNYWDGSTWYSSGTTVENDISSFKFC